MICACSIVDADNMSISPNHKFTSRASGFGIVEWVCDWFYHMTVPIIKGHLRQDNPLYIKENVEVGTEANKHSCSSSGPLRVAALSLWSLTSARR